jgi:hypothetical protein
VRFPQRSYNPAFIDLPIASRKWRSTSVELTVNTVRHRYVSVRFFGMCDFRSLLCLANVMVAVFIGFVTGTWFVSLVSRSTETGQGVSLDTPGVSLSLFKGLCEPEVWLFNDELA